MLLQLESEMDACGGISMKDGRTMKNSEVWLELNLSQLSLEVVD